MPTTGNMLVLHIQVPLSGLDRTPQQSSRCLTPPAVGFGFKGLDVDEQSGGSERLGPNIVGTEKEELSRSIPIKTEEFRALLQDEKAKSNPFADRHNHRETGPSSDEGQGKVIFKAVRPNL